MGILGSKYCALVRYFVASTVMREASLVYEVINSLGVLSRVDMDIAYQDLGCISTTDNIKAAAIRCSDGQKVQSKG